MIVLTIGSVDILSPGLVMEIERPNLHGKEPYRSSSHTTADGSMN
jgi:hypothetical protein